MERSTSYNIKVCGVGVGKPIGCTRYSQYSYTVWTSMLNRCYGGNPKHIAYADCIVSAEWLDYYTFASWYDSQEGAGTWQIDKDLLANINNLSGTVYSKETCLLLPERLNKVLQSQYVAKTGTLPMGITKRGKSSYRVLCRDENSKYTSVGTFPSIALAVANRKSFKLAVIAKVASWYKDSLPRKTREALLNFNIE